MGSLIFLAACKDTHQIPEEAISSGKYTLRETKQFRDSQNRVYKEIAESRTYNSDKQLLELKEVTKTYSFNKNDSVTEVKTFRGSQKEPIETVRKSYGKHGRTLVYQLDSKEDTVFKEFRIYNDKGQFHLAKTVYFKQNERTNLLFTELTYLQNGQISHIKFADMKIPASVSSNNEMLEFTPTSETNVESTYYSYNNQNQPLQLYSISHLGDTTIQHEYEYKNSRLHTHTIFKFYTSISYYYDEHRRLTQSIESGDREETVTVFQYQKNLIREITYTRAKKD